MTNAVDAAPPLSGGSVSPLANALVVQFSNETDAGLTHASGRVEHLQTGRRAVFASAGELLACISALLADGHAASAANEDIPAASGRDGVTQQGSSAPTAVPPPAEARGQRS